MAEKNESSSIKGVALIVAFFLLLYLAPFAVQKKSFEFKSPGSESKPAATTFPLNRTLPILRASSVGLLKGKHKVSLQELAASYPSGIIVNFWATWCPPCVEEFPSLEYLSRQLAALGEKSPQIVTLSVDEKAEDINRFYKTLAFQPTLVVLHDVDGDLARSVGTTKFPETYWINSKGQILYKWVGPQSWLSRDVINKLSTIPRS